jgi:hypothetical protein
MKTSTKHILFFLLFLCSCQEAAKNFFEDPLVLNDGSQNTILRRPKVTGVKYKGGAIVLSGERLDRITSVKLQNKNLTLSKKTESQVWATAVGNIDLFLNEVVSLVVNSAYGQSIIPIDVQLNAGSISSIHIANQSILSEDLADGAVTYSKITSSGASEGDYLYFDGQSWIPQSNGADGPGSIGIQSLSLGPGMVGKNTVISNDGNISIDTGHRKDQLLILDDDGGNYYGKLTHKGPVVIDSSDTGNSEFSYLSFSDETNNFKVKQSNTSLVIKKTAPDPEVDLLTLTEGQVLVSVPFMLTKGLTAQADSGEHFSFAGDVSSDFKVEGVKLVQLTSDDTIINSDTLTVNGATQFNGNVTIGGTLNAPDTADYAEYFRSEQELSPGDIVGFNSSNGLVRKYKIGDELIGVVTTNPSVLGNSNETGEFITPVALVGQVPFIKDQVKIVNRMIYTKDDRRVGLLLNNGLLFLKIN